MANLTERHEQLAESKWDFSDLSALFINCTLKRSPELSNTRGLADLAIAIMERNGVSVEVIRAVDHQIATGVYPDMTEHGWERDDWPEIFEKVLAADILVLLTPIWLGEKSSVCTKVIERLYGNSHLLNDAGQWAYYGRVGGCMITGNEDGAKHCAMNILYSLQHLGYVIPPQADSAWLGEAGPGPELSRSRLRRPRERLHQPQHDLPRLEPHASRANDQGRRRDPRARKPEEPVGCRVPLRLRQPRLPLNFRDQRAGDSVEEHGRVRDDREPAERRTRGKLVSSQGRVGKRTGVGVRGCVGGRVGQAGVGHTGLSRADVGTEVPRHVNRVVQTREAGQDRGRIQAPGPCGRRRDRAHRLFDLGAQLRARRRGADNSRSRPLLPTLPRGDQLS